jgi:ComF family protein
MSFLDMIVGKIAPHDCLACGIEGDLLCSSCLVTLKTVPERCYRCCAIMNKSLTCLVCRGTSPLHSVRAATVYGSVAKQLIWKLKLAGAQTAARIMAKRMTNLVDITTRAIIVPVPTATGRVRQRGYDQARLLARELSRQTRLPYYDCLARSGQTHQHGLSRHERLTQLAVAFRVKRPGIVRRFRVILVDDVTTTGATLEAAATVLYAAGAAQIDAVVFAQPEVENSQSLIK